MPNPVDDQAIDLITAALTARAEAAEARVTELVTQRDFLLNHRETIKVERDQAQERLDVLEAAARAIVADCRVPRGDYLGDLCRWCENTIDRDGHRPGCPVGVLLPLLEGTP
jgi:hypothetical protein